jgi:hypothetical protein
MPSPFRRADQTAPVLAGCFEYTTVVRNRPRTLDAWRVTTTSVDIADRVAQLLGGRAQRDPTAGLAEVLTAAATVGILLFGPAALYVQWQHAGQPCDGATQSDGHPCACHGDLAQRRAAARQGWGCQPQAELRFRLSRLPQLGTFRFTCEDWSFVELVAMTQAMLHGRKSAVPITAWLGLRRSLYAVRAGVVLPYTHPVITLVDDDRPSWSVSDARSAGEQPR